MGRATIEARHTLHTFPEQHEMQAVVLVKLQDGNIDFQGITNYEFGNNAHVEQKLMVMLNTKYGAIANIPSNSTVIFAAKWSPCQECTNFLIPDFLRRADVVSRNIRVKFRYENYYLDGLYPNSLASKKHLWPNQGQATAAYSTLSTSFPAHSRINWSYDEPSSTMTDKVKPLIVFALANVDKTHLFETWHL
nr:hypothetical protein [uncultured Pseudomonas sp.]